MLEVYVLLVSLTKGAASALPRLLQLLDPLLLIRLAGEELCMSVRATERGVIVAPLPLVLLSEPEYDAAGGARNRRKGYDSTTGLPTVPSNIG
jgi:hypothetical protein